MNTEQKLEFRPKFWTHSAAAIVVSVSALLATVPTGFAFEPLPHAAPEEQLINRQLLEAAFDNAHDVEGLRALMVVRNGHVVAEQFMQTYPPSRHHVFSVTKSVVSTLIGIAIERGFITSVDARMVDYLPQRLLPLPANKQGITIRHLLTMTSGIDWHESSMWFSWTSSSDQAAWILDQPLNHTPGTYYYYDTAASHLLSLVLREATGIHTLDFADAYLFQPLGITSRYWQRDSQGAPFGGHGLWLRAEDMARLGVLFLQDGQWGGEQVISPSWVAEASSAKILLNASFGPLQAIDYGYLWWLDRNVRGGAFLAWGFAGQFVFCVPELDLVIVASSDGEVGWDEANDQEEAVLNLIVNEVLPAVQHPYARRLNRSTPFRAPRAHNSELHTFQGVTPN
ncbi:MAG: serine hydrolase [bacterium]|nr:serine hydrolase [bacterium]